MTPPTIVVVGAGFAGTVTTIRILERAPRARLVLFNRSGPVARGLAYGTHSATHLLNVPAGNMSAFAERPSDFLDFARRHDPNVESGTFVPRSLYGDYLADALMRAVESASGTTQVERRSSEVVGLNPVERGVEVSTDDGATFVADEVVLALGNLPPRLPSTLSAPIAGDARFVEDPWIPGALRPIKSGDHVMLVGTGLTMVDVALSISARHGNAVRMTAISRRGLLPQAHRAGGAHATAGLIPDNLAGQARSASELMRVVRECVDRCVAAGGDWRDVVGALRPQTVALWRNLSASDRARFFRHIRPYWEVHRHRMAPVSAERINHLQSTGTLAVRRGRLEAFRPDAQGIEVAYRSPRESTALRAHWVVNCTGPASDVRAVADPLLGDLVRRGAIKPDDLRLGVETDADYHLLDANGTPQTRMRYVGPLLRATHWEATAVPELRMHAAQVAARVLDALPHHERTPV